MTDRYFILDSDIGSDIDDAMALLLCLRLQNFPLVAITTVYNCVELRARIAKKMLMLENRDVPVGIGVGDPLDELKLIWETGHEGEGLLSEKELSIPLVDFGITSDGIDLLIKKANEFQGKVEIITLGQFTNLATAFQRDSDFGDNIKRIWSMSAGVTFNEEVPSDFPNPSEEYLSIPSHNIRTDIRAAEIVLDSGIPITFVGNDVTTKVFFNQADIQIVASQGSELNKTVMKMMEIWLNYRSKIFDVEMKRTCLHDALVVGEAIGMNFTEKVSIDIRIDRDLLGGTFAKYNPESPHQISWSVNAEAFEKWYKKTVCKAD